MTLVRIMLHVIPEKQKEVLLTLLSLMELPEKEKGCLNYDIFCAINDKNCFILISEWKNRQYVDQHMRSDRFSILLGTKSLLREPISIQIVPFSDFEGMDAVNSARSKNPGL